MNSPFASNRLVLASLCGLGLLTLVFDSCGPAPTYTRTGIDQLGTGGGPVGEGTGGHLVTSSGGAAGGAPAGTGGMTASGGAGGGHPVGGAAGGGAVGGRPGTGGAVAAGGTAGGTVIATGGAGMAGAGAGGVIATGGVVATGGASSGGVTGTAGSGSGGVVATGGTSSGGATAAGGKGGGMAAGGMAGGVATGGAGGGFGTPTAVDCSAPTAPASGILSDFNRQPAATGRWAASNGLMGTLFAFTQDSTSTAAATVGNAPSDLHLVASVASNTYAGGGILFDSCQSIGGFTSIRFSVSGTNNCPIWLQIQTFNLKPNTDIPQGGCTSNCMNYPTVQNVPLSPSPVTVPLSSFSPWSSTLAGQVVGVYWFLDTISNKPACTTDLHFDDITLVP